MARSRGRISRREWLLLLLPLLALLTIPYGEWQVQRKSREMLAAVRAGDMGEVQRLLDSGAGLNWREPGGDPPLAAAIIANQPDIAHYLINRGADVSVTSKNGLPMVPLALRDGGDLPVLNALKATGAPSDPISDMMIAVLRSEPENVITFLNNGVPVDAVNRNNDSWTSLMWSASNGDVVMTKFLLRHGASPFRRDYRNMRALELARMFEQMGLASPPVRPPDYPGTIAALKLAMQRQLPKSTPVETKSRPSSSPAISSSAPRLRAR